MTDIVERLRRKVFHGPTMEAAHTRTVEWQAADEIERLRAVLTHIYAWYPISVNQPRKTIDDMRNYARAALEVKND